VTGGNIPEPSSCVSAAQEQTSVGRKRDVVDSIGITDEQLDFLAGLYIPLPNDSINAAGENSLPILGINDRVGVVGTLNTWSCCPVCTSHRRAVPSFEVVTTVRLSGEKAGSFKP